MAANGKDLLDGLLAPKPKPVPVAVPPPEPEEPSAAPEVEEPAQVPARRVRRSTGLAEALLPEIEEPVRYVTTTFRLTEAQHQWVRRAAMRFVEKRGRGKADGSEVIRALIDYAMQNWSL